MKERNTFTNLLEKDAPLEKFYFARRLGEEIDGK